MSHLPPQAKIYYCATANIPSATPEDLDLFLDSQERERYHRMRPAVGATFLQGRRMMKQAIADQLELPLSDVCFSYTDNGKPYLADHPHCYFNISHCSTAVVAVVASLNVGVDVETINRRAGKIDPPWMSPSKFMHAHTAQWVEQQSTPVEKARVFTLLWTLLESHVKLADCSIFKATKECALTLCESEGQQRVKVATDVSTYASNSYWVAFKGWSETQAEPADIVALAFTERPTLEVFTWLTHKSHRVEQPEYLID